MLLLPVRSVWIGLEEESAVVLCTYSAKRGALLYTLFGVLPSSTLSCVHQTCATLCIQEGQDRWQLSSEAGEQSHLVRGAQAAHTVIRTGFKAFFTYFFFNIVSLTQLFLKIKSSIFKFISVNPALGFAILACRAPKRRKLAQLYYVHTSIP